MTRKRKLLLRVVFPSQKASFVTGSSPPRVSSHTMTSTSDITQKYEEMFAHRFTAEDEEYQQYVKRGMDPPPILDNWRGRSGGHQRNRDQRFQDNRPFRDRGERRDWSNRPDQQWHGRGWGNNYQGHRQGQSYHSPYGQQNSYNSYNQRPRQDYY